MSLSPSLQVPQPPSLHALHGRLKQASFIRTLDAAFSTIPAVALSTILAAALFATLSLSILSSPALAQTIAVEDFAAHPQFKQARVSPDGAHFALTLQNPTQGLLVVFNSETFQPEATFGTAEGSGFHEFWWANNERIVFSTANLRGSLVDPVPNGDLHATNIDDTDKFALAGPAVGQFGVHQLVDTYRNDDDFVMLMRQGGFGGFGASTGPTLMKLNINRQPRVQPATTRSTGSNSNDGTPGPFASGGLMTNRDGELGLAYMPSADGLQVQILDGRRWRTVEDMAGAEAASALADASELIGFSRGDSGLYYFAPSSTETSGLYYLNLDSGRTEELYSSERYDLGRDDLVWTADGEELIGVKYLGNFPEAHYFTDHPEVGLNQQLDEAFPGYLVKLMSFSADGQIALAEVTSDYAARALYMLDRNDGQFRFISSSHPNLPAESMALVEPVVISARDGVTLEGYLTRPEGAVDGEGPLVVIPHDGPSGVRDSILFNPEVQLLASRGYSVLQINYRGSAGYGEEFAALGQGNWSGSVIDDIIDATLWASSSVTDGERVCIYGSGSFAAYAALMASARNPDMFSCVVAQSGLYDFSLVNPPEEVAGGPGRGRGGPPMPMMPPGSGFMSTLLGADQATRDAASIMAQVDSIAAPVLLVHGGNDTVAPVAHANNLSAALSEAGVPVSTMIKEDEGHGYADPDNRIEYYNELLGFLGEHL